MAYVSLKKMPKPSREYSVGFDTLSGGLNLQELDYRISNNESPEMKNLMWREGVLACRDGQVFVRVNPDGTPVATNIGTFVCAYDRLWNGYMFAHVGNKIFKYDPETGIPSTVYTATGTMSNKGKFFSYNEKLYYKTRGFYIVITYNSGTGTFSASDVTGYVPVTYINCHPENGSGTAYQPENRLSSSKTLWYNASFVLSASPSSGLEVSIESSYFRMKVNTPGTYTFSYDGTNWKLDGNNVNLLDYGMTLGGTPSNGATIVVTYRFVNEYYLPVEADTITSVKVDGSARSKEVLTISCSPESLGATLDKAVWRSYIQNSGTYEFFYDYDAASWKRNISGYPSVDPANYGISYTGTPVNGDTITVVYAHNGYYVDGNKLVFWTAPPVTYPETNNTVKITYSLANPTAYNNVMDCVYAEVYGGTGALCIVMAGSLTQPNAYFWNGQTSVAMDPSYFPMTQYQLAGDAVDAITGFGKQQGYLIIFKEGSVGRTSLETTDVDGRTTISLPYTGINAKIGCDLPGTIQLVENNLVWCNTVRGVHFLANTSAAYENNVICISDKIDDSGSSWNAGLLYDLRQGYPVVSHDDEKRYWLVVGGHAWLWDYYISNYKNPSWFFFDNIKGLGFVQELSDMWHFDSLGRLTHFERVYFDYDPDNGAINKVLRFATQFFNTYDNYKTVNSVIINTRSDTDCEIDLTYMTDYEVRKDLTTLKATAWRLTPRNLTFRDLSGSGFANVFRRKAHCRRVQYFTMKLENNTPGTDMSIVSAQIFYTYQGRQR